MENTSSAAPRSPEAAVHTGKPSSGLLIRVLPLVGIAILLAAAYAAGLGDYLSLDGLRRHQAELLGFVEKDLLLAALTYVLVYITVVAVSFPGSGIMTITGGFLFGTLLGTVLAAFSATIGAILIFLIARSSFGDVVARRAGPRVERLRRGFLEEGFSYLLFLRLVPLFPFWLVNLAAALFAMPLLPYVGATALGAVPPAFVFAFFGAGLSTALESGEGPISSKLLVALALLGLMALVPPLVRRLRPGGRSGERQ